MAPYLFDEFFASGQQESISPFLTPESRPWGRNLDLKSSLAAALFLVIAFSLHWTHSHLSNASLALCFFLAGTPAVIDAFDDLKNLEINIDVLMTVAAFVALSIGSGLEGALLLVLFELSAALEHLVQTKARGALHNLNNLAPKFALVADPDGNFIQKAVRDIAVGETLLVKAGETVPLDGLIREGKSSLNLVHLTGETMPVSKGPGDEVPAGGRNLDAALTLEVKRTSADSTLSRIIRLIAEATEAKPQLERWLDRFGKKYATSIILLTIAFALLLPLVFGLSWEKGVYQSLAFLIAASPCALIIATPTAYLSALSACARKGLLVKGGVVLDALAAVRQIAFDKTGTLTTGELTLVEVIPLQSGGMSPQEATLLAAALERHVVHPISAALERSAKGTPLPEIEHFEQIPGTGLKAQFRGEEVRIGVADFVQERLSSEGAARLEEERRRTAAPILVALSVGSVGFVFRFSDRVREGVRGLIADLTQSGIRSIMLTGDRKESAEQVGNETGISQVYASLTPSEKLERVGQLAMQGDLAMVGDGINDAPALARASVGISLGRIGSATAVDASDVVLLRDELLLLPWLFQKAQKTTQIVRQNVTLALSVICLATTPALLGLIPLWLAVTLHEGGTLLVGLNSLRLLKK